VEQMGDNGVFEGSEWGFWLKPRDMHRYLQKPLKTGGGGGGLGGYEKCAIFANFVISR